MRGLCSLATRLLLLLAVAGTVSLADRADRAALGARSPVAPSATHRKHLQHGRSEAMPQVHRTTVQMQESLTLSVSPATVTSAMELVTVSWSGNANGEAFDWIAAYSPVPETLDGFTQTLPVKYQNITQPGESGSTQMYILYMRAPFVFAYMRGGFDAPTVLAVSPVLDFAPELDTFPMQIHLMRTVDPTQMQVVFVTGSATTPVVQYATSLDGLQSAPMTVAATTDTYTIDDMCGDLAGSIGWRDPGLIHTALMTGLTTPSTEIFYRVGDSSTGMYSTPTSFFTAPVSSPSQPLDMFIFGDLGQADMDGSVEWEEWTTCEGQLAADIDQPASVNTTASVTNDILPASAGGTMDKTTALTVIIGDVSYARGREAIWDNFHYLLQPLASQMPVMTGLGNHDFDYPQAGIWGGTDSGGECGVAIQKRFPMPSPPSKRAKHPVSSPHASPPQGFSDSPWYSFDHGPVHLLVMSSEHAFDPASEQFEFIESDLAAVDRTRTPWSVILSHRPMYVSSPDATSPDSDMKVAALLRQYIEPLLQQYRVDAFFAGHHHDYQRSCPVFNQTCVQGHESTPVGLRGDVADPNADESEATAPTSDSTSVAPMFGTVHIVTGAAGQWDNLFLSLLWFPWLDNAVTQMHGYNRMHVRPASNGSEASMTIDFVRSADRAVLDSVTLYQADERRGQPTRLVRNELPPTPPAAVMRKKRREQRIADEELQPFDDSPVIQLS